MMYPLDCTFRLDCSAEEAEATITMAETDSQAGDSFKDFSDDESECDESHGTASSDLASSGFGFKLEGMEDLQNAVIDLLTHRSSIPTLSPSEEQGSDADHEETVLVQNLPKKLTRDQLAHVLNEAWFFGDYDLLYVMDDLKQKNHGSGSALINFRDEEACYRFRESFHGASIDAAFPGMAGKTTLQVSLAPTQGLLANVSKLEKSGVLMSMLAERPGWRPARYSQAGEIEVEIGDS